MELVAEHHLCIKKAAPTHRLSAMCYMIITGNGLAWFLTNLIASMLIITAIVMPKWLIGPEIFSLTAKNFTTQRNPSVGIYTRCTVMEKKHYHCGPFDLDGFATENYVYPPEWKAAMFFISFGFTLLAITVLLTLFTCCRQSCCGKSIHNITGSAQVVSGICVMVALFLHPLGWGAPRVLKLCGPDAEAFYPAECKIGWALYCAVAGVLLAFISGGISLKAESANMRSRIRRRIEGGERLVCVP